MSRKKILEEQLGVAFVFSILLFLLQCEGYKTSPNGPEIHETINVSTSKVNPNIRKVDTIKHRIDELSIWNQHGINCVKPWCPPDRWDDADNDSVYDYEETYVDINGNGVCDPGEPFMDANANGIWDPAEFYDPSVTGYKAPDDVGVEISLKLRNSNKLPLMGWYYAVCFAPINSGDPLCEGGDCYREAIMHCEPWVVSIRDLLMLEKGIMVGPTDQGLEELINMDSTAQWDQATGTVINSAFPISPRIVNVAFFDPTLGKKTDIMGPGYVTVSKIMQIFIEQHSGSDMVVRIVNESP